MESRDLTTGRDGVGYREIVTVLGAKLREVRKERGMALKDLAEALSTGVGRLSILESAHHSASLDAQIQTLLALGLSRSDLARALAVPDEGL